MADDPKTEVKPLTADEVKAIVASLLPKAGNDSGKLNEALVRQNRKLADQIRDLQSRSVPKDHVALAKSDADLLAEYRKLGDLKTVQTAVAELGQYKAIGDLKAVQDAVKELPAVKATLAHKEHESVLEAVSKDPDGRLRYRPDVLKRIVPEGVRFVPAKHLVKDRNGKDVEIDDYNVVDTGLDGKARTRTRQEWEQSSEIQLLMPALAATDSRPVQRQEVLRGGTGYREEGGRGPVLSIVGEEDDLNRHVKVDSYARM